MECGADSSQCEECQSHLVDYHFGEVTATTRSRVSEHLGACGACATEYCRLHAAMDAVAETAAEAPAPELQARLRRRVARELRPRVAQRVLTWLRRPVPAYQVAAIVGLMLGLGAILQLEGPAPERRSPSPAAKTRRVAPIVPGYDSPVVTSVPQNLL